MNFKLFKVVAMDVSEEIECLVGRYGSSETIFCQTISWGSAKKITFFCECPSFTSTEKVVSFYTDSLRLSTFLTFFSDSIHLLIATNEDPVRSLRAAMASLIMSRVAIVIFVPRTEWDFVETKFEEQMPVANVPYPTIVNSSTSQRKT